MAEDTPKRPKLTLRRALFLVFRGLCIAYVLVFVLLWIFQERAIFVPTQEIYATPAMEGMRKFETLHIPTSDGQKIGAWWIPNTSSSFAVIFFHGNGGNRATFLDSIGCLHRAGAAVLAIDYHGYGDSTGTPSEENTYLDADAALQYLIKEQGFPIHRIFVHGRSLGGGVTTYLATQHPDLAGIILDSTFTSLMDVAAQRFWFLPVRLICRTDYPSHKRIPNLRMPALVMHSPDDWMIPFSHAEKNYAALPGPKRFVRLSGHHNTCTDDNQELVTKSLRDFFATAPSK
jgi:pimeloyl-ACP methyl ester carboxylesterase